MVVISVVRDFDLYEKLVKSNYFYGNAKFISFDNNNENIGISKRYNSFLESYDFNTEEWFVFVHEDWQLKQNLSKTIKNLDKNFIYGVCGAFYNSKKNSQYLFGQITQSKKDGTEKVLWGLPIYCAKKVDTVDCQCLIVHSSLIKKYNFAFDEKLSFDFYTEEFSINAKENFGIETKVIPIKCHHFSYGNPREAFFESIEYVKEKYKNRKYSYGATCTSALIKVPCTKNIHLSFWFKVKRKISKIFTKIFSS